MQQVRPDSHVAANMRETHTHPIPWASPLFLVLLIPMASPSEYPPSGYAASCNNLERKGGGEEERQTETK